MNNEEETKVEGEEVVEETTEATETTEETTGETGEASENDALSGDESEEEEGTEEVVEALQEVETASYKITGLVDIFDEQGNITGQFALDSIQELPVEYGDTAVADGRAEKVEA